MKQLLSIILCLSTFTAWSYKVDIEEDRSIMFQGWEVPPPQTPSGEFAIPLMLGCKGTIGETSIDLYLNTKNKKKPVEHVELDFYDKEECYAVESKILGFLEQARLAQNKKLKDKEAINIENYSKLNHNFCSREIVSKYSLLAIIPIFFGERNFFSRPSQLSMKIVDDVPIISISKQASEIKDKYIEAREELNHAIDLEESIYKYNKGKKRLLELEIKAKNSPTEKNQKNYENYSKLQEGRKKTISTFTQKYKSDKYPVIAKQVIANLKLDPQTQASLEEEIIQAHSMKAIKYALCVAQLVEQNPGLSIERVLTHTN